MADNGDAQAQCLMGLRFSSGSDATQDLVQAAEWYRKAADQNYPVAQFNLGIMLAEGQGVKRDDAAAIGWIRRAAQAGDAGAQYNLGLRCHRDSVSHEPTGAIESRIEAYKWFQLAAAQGYKDSATSRARVTSNMTHADVAEANHRATVFQLTNESAPAA